VSRLARQAPAWTITAGLGLIYVILAPPSPDLAAASYRSYLISSGGLSLWDNGWYGGHHLLAYSLLAPALGALVGPRLLAAVSLTVATALFTELVRGSPSERRSRCSPAASPSTSGPRSRSAACWRRSAGVPGSRWR
jgi:hypothetical protein